MKNATIERDWCLCGKCRHKLFRVADAGSMIILEDVHIEIKCHSCKELNDVDFKLLEKAPQ